MRQTLAALLLLLASEQAIAREKSPQTVSFESADGLTLAGTYYDAGKRGPGALLLHMCNGDRQAWDPVARALQRSGFHVLAFSYRGFGGSEGSAPDKKASGKDMTSDEWRSDVDRALRYLKSRRGVDRERIVVGGASCGVYLALELARREPAVRAALLLAGPTTDEQALFVGARRLPVLGITAEAVFASFIKKVTDASAADTMFIQYENGGHGTQVFSNIFIREELEPLILCWFTRAVTAGQPPRTCSRGPQG
jgi:dienelactone hydrolase